MQVDPPNDASSTVDSDVELNESDSIHFHGVQRLPEKIN